MNRNCEICEGTFDPTGLDCEHVQEPVDGDIWDEVAR